MSIFIDPSGQVRSNLGHPARPRQGDPDPLLHEDRQAARGAQGQQAAVALQPHQPGLHRPARRVRLGRGAGLLPGAGQPRRMQVAGRPPKDRLDPGDVGPAPTGEPGGHAALPAPQTSRDETDPEGRLAQGRRRAAGGGAQLPPPSPSDCPGRAGRQRRLPDRRRHTARDARQPPRLGDLRRPTGQGALADRGDVPRQRPARRKPRVHQGR